MSTLKVRVIADVTSSEAVQEQSALTAAAHTLANVLAGHGDEQHQGNTSSHANTVSIVACCPTCTAAGAPAPYLQQQEQPVK
jgi:hypothetical protein